jgi:hypothetical protein
MFFAMLGSIGSEMKTVAIILKPIFCGWSVCLTDGRELARFRGPRAHERALRFLGGTRGAGAAALAAPAG